MKGTGALTTWKIADATPLAAIPMRRAGNPIDRHQARSLLCGSNWSSHD